MQICVCIEDQVLSGTLNEFLSELGHEVFSLGSGCSLLEEMTECALCGNLIITELNPNQRVNIQLIHELHKQHPDAPIVLVTDIGSILPSSMAISFGIYAYLRKPISLSELELLLTRLEMKDTGT